MKSSESGLLKDTLNFLKFYVQYKNYDIYESEIPETDFDLMYSDISTETKIKPEQGNEFSLKVSDSENESYKHEEKLRNTGKKVKPESDIVNENWNNCSTLKEFEGEIKDCVKCTDLAVKRTNLVFGYGNPEAKVVIVGEAPGAEEDKQGKPFVGRAGKLLTDILKAVNFEREEVYICNILKCRPPENRNPLPEEILNCEPYLFKQLELIKPLLILALGTFAAQTLLRSKEPLGKMRGRFHLYKGIKMMVTYHPAALLRNPGWKRPTWEDVQLFRKEYDSMIK